MRADADVIVKTLPIIILSALLPLSAARAATPTVAAAYYLRGPFTAMTSVAATTAPAGDGLAVFSWTTFEGDPFAGNVAVLSGDGPPFELSGVWSAALDDSWTRIAVGEEVQVIDATVTPPFARTKCLCSELGLDAAALESILYYDSFAGNGYVTRPVVYALGDGERTPLPFAGGDFLDWAGDARLVIGREVGGSKAPAASELTLFGYNLDTGAATTLAAPGEARAKLNPRLAADVRTSPYLAAAWRLLSLSPAEVAVPGRGGAFTNAGDAFSWREGDGSSAGQGVGDGVALAASTDGSWLVVRRPGGAATGRLVALRLAWR